MKTLSETYFGKALGVLANAVMRHRWLFFWPQMILLVLCILYSIAFKKFDPSRDNLVGEGHAYHKTYLEYRTNFPSQEDMVVVVESENPEKNRQFVERLGARLEAEAATGHSPFTNVLYRNDFKMLGHKALLFLKTNELQGLREQLTAFLPFIQRFTEVTNLNSLFLMMNRQFWDAAKNPDDPGLESSMKALPMLQKIVDQGRVALKRPGTPPSPGIAALFGASDRDVYLTAGTNDQIYLVTAQARSADLNDAAVERLRHLVAETQLEVPGLNIGVTGGPVLDYDEMLQSQKDSTVASIVSLVLCALIFIYGYQETGRPLKATFCLVVGLAYTLAFTFLSVGHLNILTVTFLPILIGLAIDFGVHLITRYEEELRLGANEEQSMRKAIVFTGQGIFTGALTTAVAFAAMYLTRFQGIKEMGIICGGGMIICLIPMMTMLPVMLFRGRQNVMDKEQVKKPALRERLERIWLRFPVVTIGVTLTLVALAATQLGKVRFDYDLLNMQSAGLPAVVFEKKLIAAEGKAVIFAVAMADSAEAAVKLEEEFRKLNTVSDIDSMAPRVVGDQTDRLRLIGEIKREIASIHFLPPDLKPVDLDELSQTLYSTAGLLGQATNRSEVLRDPVLFNQLTNLVDSMRNKLRGELFRGSDREHEIASHKLAYFQQALFRDVQDTFRALQEQDNSSPMRAEDLPEALRNRFIGKTGRHLLQIYPKEDIWERNAQERFVMELQKVDPKVTGVPVQLYHYTKLLKDSYEQAAWYALGVISIMVLFHFRSFSSVILALLPVAVGFIWLCGWMGFYDIAFNPANIMTLPLVVGIGVTNGIHILNRFAEEKSPSILAKSTGKAVFISGLTTIAGFGSLILAKHQGIQSLGQIMAMGVTLCMVAGLTFLPAVLCLWTPWRGIAKKQPSGDNARSTLGREEPR